MKKPQSIRILSYNIHKGFNTGNRRFVLKAIKDSIKPLDANIVFLQEVLGEHGTHQKKVKDWPTISQFEYLADEIWQHYAYGKNAVYDAGHHGNAILSAFPISSWSNMNISSSRFENRGLLHAIIEIPEKPSTLHCFCAHLSLFQKGRTKQVQTISKAISEATADGSPFILAGDFNDWQNKASQDLAKQLGAEEVFVSRYGNHAKTFPSTAPFLCLDRIYVRGLEIADAKILSGPPWSRLSDHLALYAELSLK